MAEDTAEKFVELLVASGCTEADAVDVATKVANVVAAAWGAEGRGVEGLGIAADEGLPVEPAVAELLERLEVLRAATDDAITALRGR